MIALQQTEKQYHGSAPNQAKYDIVGLENNIVDTQGITHIKFSQDILV